MPQLQQQGRGGELKPIAMPTSLQAGLLREMRKVKFTIGIEKQKLCSGKNLLHLHLLLLLMTKNCHLPTWITRLTLTLFLVVLFFLNNGVGREVSQ